MGVWNNRTVSQFWRIAVWNQYVSKTGTSLGVQWSNLHAFPAGGPGSIPGQGTKILHAAGNGQTKQKINKWLNKRCQQDCVLSETYGEILLCFLLASGGLRSLQHSWIIEASLQFSLFSRFALLLVYLHTALCLEKQKSYQRPAALHPTYKFILPSDFRWNTQFNP